MKKKFIYLLLIIMINFVGFYILSPEIFNVCKNSCFTNPTTFGIGQPLFFGMLPITLTFFIFLFIKNERMGNLYKIFVYYFLVSIILVSLMPLDCNALDPICITKSTVAIFLGIAFFIFSLVKVARKQSLNPPMVVK